MSINHQPRIISASIRDVQFGTSVTVIEPVNLYECEIGDGAFVGPFVEIQRGVKIGARTRVQSHCFVCELVSVGEDCFIGHGVMFVNDLFRGGGASSDPADWKPTKIGNRVSIGSNATLLPVSVCDNVVIGAGAVVTKDIVQPGVYCGNPAKYLRSLRAEES
ncbi:acyltransferase [Neorhodopirellula pilleata]|uniref:Bifunctional protein GlmU n=1 Tax=Neorhodopirellula pilleata TaxID=2714738 RepID=A0A5C6AVP4_9BACT|nr:acyltransferase [Neorhodopirellula pilleata]TWU03668.1 Bifunctional protein GlmU [Neorhodopirellula pilleata]